MKRQIKLASLLGWVVAAATSCSQEASVLEQQYESKIVDNSLVNLDLLSPGPYQVKSEEYRLPAVIDSQVLNARPHTGSDIKIEVAGKAYLPNKPGKAPLIVFLHGNHATCGLDIGDGNPRLDFDLTYTTDGNCPDGLIPAPSYLGYEYAATHLASHGYAVISIDANRGITGLDTQPFGHDYFDFGLIAARGRLVLRNLETFYKWNQGNRSSFSSLNIANKINFKQIGLVGHSRGGEGVRAAYTIYNESRSTDYWKRQIPNMSIKGVFEIAPVDFGIEQSGNRTTYEANGIPWHLLIAGCDQDVFNFQGTAAYKRMLDFVDGESKSIYTAWGANHNFFNTEWQVSDAGECDGQQEPLWSQNAPLLNSAFPNITPAVLENLGQANARLGLTGSSQQRNIAKGSLLAFFKAYLRNTPNETYLRVFDPQYRLPKQLSSQSLVSREFIQDDLSKSVLNTNISQVQTQGNITALTTRDWADQELDRLIQALNTSRNRSNVETPFTRSGFSFSWQGAGQKQVVIDLNDFNPQNYWTLDMVAGSRMICLDSFDCASDRALNVDIQLEDASGNRSSSVNLKDYAEIRSLHDQLFFPFPLNFSDLEYDIVYIPLLMHTVRFELTDFNWNHSPSVIDKMVLSINDSNDGQMSVTDVFTVKR